MSHLISFESTPKPKKEAKSVQKSKKSIYSIQQNKAQYEWTKVKKSIAFYTNNNQQ